MLRKKAAMDCSEISNISCRDLSEKTSLKRENFILDLFLLFFTFSISEQVRGEITGKSVPRGIIPVSAFLIKKRVLRAAMPLPILRGGSQGRIYYIF